MATKFDAVRNEMIDEIKNLYESKGYDVLKTGSQEICLPILAEDGDEGYLVITFKIPKGSRDGDAYDGYLMAQDFQEKQILKAEKQKEMQAKKEAKMKKDAEAKAKKKAKKEEE